MYSDTGEHFKSFTQCAIVTGTVAGKLKTPLHPVPVQRAFQIVGVDVMDLSVTKSGNMHVLVFQDFLTKWPMVYPISISKLFTLFDSLLSRFSPCLVHQKLCFLTGVRNCYRT